MRAAVFQGEGKSIAIEDIAMPSPGPDDVIVKVAACGICGSDIAMTASGPMSYPPGRLGHEYSGEVVEIGTNVTSLVLGQKVACLPVTPCGACRGCRTGNPVFCSSPRQTAEGSFGFGGFAEFVSVPAAGAKVLPATLSLADGALIEPMACGLHALRMAGMKPGASVLVLGAGSMALSIILWARRLGAGKVTVAARSSRAREIVGALGADLFHSFAGDDPAELSASLADGADIVAECIGKEGMLSQAMSYVALQGTVISMGMCQHADPVLPAACTYREARIVFPMAYTVDEFVETARMFDREGINPSLCVTKVIGLDALPATVDAIREGREGGKILVDPAIR